MVLGLVFGVLLVTPACYAGGAMIVVPAENQEGPQGSQISEKRSQEIEQKMNAFSKDMQKKEKEQLQEQEPEKEVPKRPVPEKRF